MSRYTDLQSVKQILRLGSSTKVRFPANSLTSLNIYEKGLKSSSINTSLIFRHQNLVIDPVLKDLAELAILFTSPTDFEVYAKVGNVGSLLLDGTGDIATTYVYNGEVSIPTTCWGGTIKAEDVVKLVLSPHISDEDALQIIEDTESIIDAMIFNVSGNLPYPNSDLGQDWFGGLIPQTVAIAAKKLSAYYIFKYVFPDYNCEDGKCRFLDEWKRDAEKMLSDYIRQLNITAPSVISFPPIINSIGSEEVGFFKMQDSSDGDPSGWDSEDIFRRG